LEIEKEHEKESAGNVDVLISKGAEPPTAITAMMTTMNV
jgi:hypothetical protein